MSEILHEVIIEAEPAKIFQALTEQEALANWWTAKAKAEPKVGAVDEFQFNGGRYVITLEVTDLEPDKNVSWKVLQAAPDWAGTEVSWNLTPLEQSTKLLFAHRDFASSKGSLPSASYNWARYISSLKDYVETGKGSPNLG